MKAWIDLRSDTVTKPTDKMREAMANAVVGDDVYEDDPTVIELEKYAAEIIGKEAALFVPTGTFGNQLALFTHCNRGDEVILGEDCHIVAHEAGAPAVIAGVQLRTLETSLGKMDIEKVEKTIRVGIDIHWPTTRLICLENAYSNGTAVSAEYMAQIKQIADQHQIKIHLDGARIFNAAYSLGVDAKELTKYSDSVMFCLSKGLCAPIGSILAGSKEFIQQARKNRKLLGGGMRQVGILAAAGLIALKEVRLQLGNDHYNARNLASKLATLPSVVIQEDWNEINMVFCTIDSTIPANQIVEKLCKKGFKVNGPHDGYWRFVTHRSVSNANVNAFVEALTNILTNEEDIDPLFNSRHDSTIDLAISIAETNLENAINKLRAIPVDEEVPFKFKSNSQSTLNQINTVQEEVVVTNSDGFQPIPSVEKWHREHSLATASAPETAMVSEEPKRVLRYTRVHRNINM